MSHPHAQLIRDTCRQVLAVCKSLGLPDDDVLHCIATSQVLNAQGVPATWTVQQLDLNTTRVWGLQMATFCVADEPYDMRGRAQAWDVLGQHRLGEIVRRWGLVLDEGNDLAGVSGGILPSEAIAARPPGFLDRCEEVAALVLARMTDPALPLPAPLLRLPPHGGPLVFARYETQAHELVVAANPLGMLDLLAQWQVDPDTARPADLPQTLVRLLANMRLAPNATEQHQQTIQAFNRLCQAGADPTLGSYEGDSLLTHAICGGLVPLARHMIDHGLAIALPATGSKNWQSPLVSALLNDHAGLADYLLNRGAPLAPADNNHADPLAVAVRGGHRELAEKLVRLGADPLAVSRAGDTLLHVVVGSNTSQRTKHHLATWFLTQGVDPHAENDRQETAIAWAHRTRQGKLVDLMENWQANQIDRATPQSAARRARRTL